MVFFASYRLPLPSNWFKSILLLLLILILQNIYAHSKPITTDTTIVKSLDEDWLIYSKQYATYIPVTNQEIANHRILHQWINVASYTNFELMVVLPTQSTLFINNLLIDRNVSSSTINKLLPISSLMVDYSSNFFVSIYNTAAQVQIPKMYIVSVHEKMLASNNFKNQISAFQPSIRKRSYAHQGSIMIFLVAIFLIATIKNTDNEISFSFLGFRNILSNNLLEDTQLLHLWRFSILGIIYLTSLLMAFLAQYSVQSPIIFDTAQQLFAHHSDNNFLNILLLSSWIFAFFLLRFLALNTLGWFFKQDQLVKIHFFDNIKLLLKCMILLSLTYFIADLSGLISHQTLAIWLRVCLILTLILLLIKNLYITTKITHFRNLYLFSYLCISEILPTLFLIRFLLN